MLHGPHKRELFRACSVLFGRHLARKTNLLMHLESSRLRAAYLRKALETHPDRAQALGRNEDELNERFKEVNLAYETLKQAIEAGDKGVFSHGHRKGEGREKPPASGRKSQSSFSDHYYEGTLPKRELLIGQFLYYSGIVSWRTLVDAIIWQKRQRPPIGQIARRWGMLSSHDIRRILRNRGYRERFGQYAWRKGYINSFELMALLGRQRNLQRPIGEYFVEKRILSVSAMEKMLQRQYLHNTRVRWGKF